MPAAGEEVADQLVAGGGEDRLGVELDPLDVELAVAQPHHQAVVGLGGDLEHLGHRGPVDDERVVAGGLERLGQPGEHAAVTVVDERGLAVHDLRRPDDVAAVHLADALVPEADAEHGGAPGEAGDDLVRQAGVLGPARARADQHAVGLELVDLLDGQGVAAVHERLGAELAQVLDQVEHERVVVVEHEDPGGHRPVTLPPGPPGPDRDSPPVRAAGAPGRPWSEH